MKYISILLFIYSVMITQPVQADLISDGEYLMDKAEQFYPRLFPSNQETQMSEIYRYRFYPLTDTYLYINQTNSGIYLLGGIFGSSHLYFFDNTDGALSFFKKKEGIFEKIRITNFSFLKKNNPRLSTNLSLEIIDNKITGRVPIDVPLDSLVASFEFNGESVKVGDKNQTSGESKNNYKNIVSYSVMTEVGAARQYTVDIVRFTGLPIVFITTENEALIDSKDDYRKGNVKIVGGRGYKDLESVMKIRGRGNTTWAGSPKKPYQMKLSKKKEVLGMRADKKWVFLGYWAPTIPPKRSTVRI
jgi:hypothetical protein